jgi:pimeloyl-ACP methyl ester carboxylesterase
MPSMATGVSTIYFEQAGGGLDIVWVCGGGGLPDETWSRYQVPAFPEYRSTVFHNRGIGRTTCRQDLPWTIADFAKDTASLVEHACAPPVVVIGKSMGALITTQLALDRPDLVRLAIAMGTIGKSTGWVHDYMRAEIAYRQEGGSLGGLMAICHYAAMLNPSDELGDEETWEVLKHQYRGFGEEPGRNENERSLIAQWDACDTFDCLDRLPGCTVPLHVVGLGQDVQAPPSYGRLVADLAPTGVFHLLEGHGHYSLWSPKRAHEANRLLREILETAGDSRASMVSPEETSYNRHSRDPQARVIRPLEEEEQ